MRSEDKARLIKRYEDRLDQHGYAPASLGWGKSGSQALRFSVLASGALAEPDSSVLDLGCGFCDLFDFLQAHGWQGRYVGVDLVPGFIDIARERHPGLELYCGDFSELDPRIGPFDQIIASGVFNVQPLNQDPLQYLRASLAKLLKLCAGTLCLDFLSSQVDYEQEGAFHLDPSQALELAFELSRRVSLRHDYMPYEFALFIYNDQRIDQQNVFSSHQTKEA